MTAIIIIAYIMAMFGVLFCLLVARHDKIYEDRYDDYDTDNAEIGLTILMAVFWPIVMPFWCIIRAAKTFTDDKHRGAQ